MTEEKAPEVTKPERTESEAAEFSLIEERTRDYLRSESEKSSLFPLILSEMDKNRTLIMLIPLVLQELQIYGQRICSISPYPKW